MNTKSKGDYFVIHTFMPRLMGLGGSELLVYALIYSFNSKDEDFYGSVSYISERTGLSESSVKRALKSLTTIKYIFRDSVTKQGTVKYSINKPFLNKYVLNEEKVNESKDVHEGHFDTPDDVVQNEPAPGSKRTLRGVKMSYNNKEIINNTTSTSSYAGEKDNSSIGRYGFEKLVMLSADQIAELYRRYGEDVTEEYIIKLDSYLASYPLSYFKNHYKTIISWIEEDFRI